MFLVKTGENFQSFQRLNYSVSRHIHSSELFTPMVGKIV